MSMSKGGSVPQLRWSSVSRAASDRTVAAIAKPETPFVRVDLGDQISGNAWRVFHLDKKAGFEREISFGGFEHLAVPLRLLGKDGSVGTIAFVGKACYAARTTRAGLGLGLNRLWLAALGCGFCLPVVEIIDAPTLHWWVEHFEGSAAGVDLVVMRDIGKAFEDAEQLLVPGAPARRSSRS